MRLKISLIFGVLFGQLGGLFVPAVAQATSSNVIISGLQTASLNSTSEEFVELLNPTSDTASITGWQLQYRAATTANGSDCTKGWTAKATNISGSIAPGGRYLLTTNGYLAGDSTFTSGLASSAGTVRIVDAAKVQVDALAWGGAYCGVGAPAPAPAAGQSLARHEGLGGEHEDNSIDFIAQAFPDVAPPMPSATPVIPIDTTSPAPTPEQIPEPVADPAIGSGSAITSSFIINELLIDPVGPQTDAQDEFIELFNAGSDPIDTEGYAIKTGSSQIKLPKSLVAPDEYLVITSAGTSLSLSNSGGVANLLDPSGEVIDTAGAWGPAIPGSSWAFLDDAWRWTLTPTPGEANILTGDTAVTGEHFPIELSEVLPDPAAPLTDAEDEFIELYNPTDQPVDLSGYVLKVGHDLTAKYVINGVIIPPTGYVSIKSADSKLALSNSGSSVALYAPSGVQLGQTVTYPKAASGNSWARLNEAWDWTSEPTPGNINVIAPVAAAAAKAVKSKASAKAAVPKAKAAAKTKAATKVKAAKTTKAKKTNKPLLAGTTSSGGRWLLYILAGLTLGYIIYEFRHDIRNYYYKLRGYPIGRPAPVPVIAGRGSDRAGQRPGRG